MADLTIKGLTKRFGDVVAVDRLSLEVSDKEFLVLLGPSGCGKSTVLRCIAGLEAPDEGEIYIGGLLVNGIPPKERDVAMVFQSYALYPHMSVFDNIAFPLRMRNFSKSEIAYRVRKVASLLGIEGLLYRKPKQLSGGERQRVALGRAIVREPRAFLMDEPLSNLDAKLRVQMRAELKRLQKDIGVTMIYVTHDQVEAMAMADNIAIMNAGMLQQVGPPDEIYATPANAFVAGFIGSPPTNLIDCAFVERDHKPYLDVGTLKLELPIEVASKVKRVGSSELILGVRPKDVSVRIEPTADPSSYSIKAEVYVTEPLGEQVIVDLKIGDLMLKAVESAGFKAESGRQVHAVFEKDRIHLFDRKSGQIIV